MKYVALLRGINVGGNSIVKMVDLKECFEREGFTKVVTYINSGNVIFQTDENDLTKIASKIEEAITKRFGFTIRVVVLSKSNLESVMEKAPSSWKKGKDLRCYISFMKRSTTVDQAFEQIDVREGVDFLDKGPGVLYMGTTLSGLTKSGFTKLIGMKIYKEMTMRNVNTVRKILILMEKND